jgi:hypothetical protein
VITHGTDSHNETNVECWRSRWPGKMEVVRSGHGPWSWTQRQQYETTPQRFMTLRRRVTMSSGKRTRGLTPVAGGQSSSAGRRMPLFTPEDLRVLAMVRYVISRPVKLTMRQGIPTYLKVWRCAAGTPGRSYPLSHQIVMLFAHLLQDEGPGSGRF